MDKALAAAERLSLLKIKDRKKALTALTDSVKCAENILAYSKGQSTTRSGPSSSPKSSTQVIKPLVSLCNEEPWDRERSLRPDVVVQSKGSLDNAGHKMEGYLVAPSWQRK